MPKKQTLSLSLAGTSLALKRLKGLSHATIIDAANALNDEHELIMTEAKKRTPVDTSALRTSGHVKPVKIMKTNAISEGGFGGAAAGYAIYVHENLNNHHPVGRAKFYESAILDAVSGMRVRMSRNIKALK